MTERIAWRFIDPSDATAEEVVWHVNPFQDNGSNVFNRTPNYTVVAGMRRSSAGPTIDTIMHQARIDQSSFSYDGFIYDAAQLAMMEDWVSRRHPVEMWDDLNRGWLVYLLGIDLSRERKRKNPYKHRYTLTGLILESL